MEVSFFKEGNVTCVYIVSNRRRDPRMLKEGRRSLMWLEKEALPTGRLHSPQCQAFISGAISCPATNNTYSVTLFLGLATSEDGEKGKGDYC